MTGSATLPRTDTLVPAAASVGVRGSGAVPHVAALDGLRGVAVAAVVAYHVRPDLVPGGYLGVDVFFVLSGYLITSLLLAEHERSGRIDLGAFVRRRARRLLPALFVVVAATVVWGAIVLEGAELARLRDQVWSTCAYLTNWQLVAAGESYFGAFVVPSPLRHAWSLAVEEQFYLVWPLTVVAVARRGRRAVGIVAVAGAVASAFALAVSFDAVDPSRAYFGTDSRILEPLIGAALAAAAPLTRVAHPDRIGALRLPVARRLAGAVVAGMGLALAAAFLAADDRAAAYYRGGAAALAVVTGLLVVALAAGLPGAGVLSWRPLVAVGTISYGIYLWHWPVLVAVRHGERDPGMVVSLGAVGVSVALAAASYHLLERPIRHHRRLASGARGAGRLTVAMALVPALALAAVATVVLRPSTPAAATSAEEVMAELEAGGSPPALDDPASVAAPPGLDDPGPPPAAPPGLDDPRPPPAAAPLVVALVGDSSAWTLGGGPVGFTLEHGAYESPFDDTRIRLLNLGRKGWSLTPGELLLPGGPRPRAPEAPDYEQAWVDAIARARPDVVVLLVGWAEIFDHRVDTTTVEVGSPAHRRAVLDAGGRLLDAWAGASPTSRFVVATTPGFPAERREGDMAEFLAGADPRVEALNAALRDLAVGRDRVEVLEFGAWLCPEECRTTPDGELVRPDGVHFSSAGARFVADWLTPRLEEIAGR